MTIDQYDPSEPPDPQAWLALDEAERIRLIKAWHDAADAAQGERPDMHAVFHAIVENQIALGDPPMVAVKLRQLLARGLDRHEAVHAISSVLAERLRLAARPGHQAGNESPLYEAALRRLNARRWMRPGR
jgi:Domain of unknown function (DUF1841)